MTKLTIERLDKLQDNLLQFQDAYSDPADKENYDIFVDALHVLDEFKAAKEKLLACEQAAKNPVTWIVHMRTGDQFTTDGDFVGLGESTHGIHSTPLYAAPVLPKQPNNLDELLSAVEEVLRISDRKHDAWDRAYAAIASISNGVTAPAQPVIPATHKNTASPMLLNFYIAYHSWVKSGASENGLFLRNAGLCANAYDYFQLVGAPSDSLLEEMHNNFVVNGLNEKLPFNDNPDHYEKESKNALCHLNTARAQWVEAKAQPVIPEQCQRISDDDLVAVPRSVLACAGYAYGKAGMKDGKAYAQLKKYQFAPAITAQPVSEPCKLPDGIGVNGASIWRDVAPEKYCQFVTDNYANYQGAWLCGKSAEVLCYLLSMSGYEGKKVSTEINGVGHIYVRCGDLILDPTIKQFGDYPEISTGKHPAAPAQESE